MEIFSIKVNSMDLHSMKPWLLCSTKDGTCFIWDLIKGESKRFYVSRYCVKNAIFIETNNLIVAGSKDGFISTYNYYSFENVSNFRAHSASIGFMCTHPKKPFLFTCGGDNLVKLWNYDEDWKSIATFYGFERYVTQLKVMPLDNELFATASMDTTIKVWHLFQSLPSITLKGHESGVSAIEWLDNQINIISGDVRGTLKIWDFISVTCFLTFDAHREMISSILAINESLFISSSRNGELKFWDSDIFTTKERRQYNFVTEILLLSKNMDLIIGGESGVFKTNFDTDKPLLCMFHSHKFVKYTKKVLQSGYVDRQQNLSKTASYIPSIVIKKSEIVDFFPKKLEFNSNGRFIAMSNDKEYAIYTSAVCRLKKFGEAKSFIWSNFGNDYAILKNKHTIEIHKNFEKNFVLELESDASSLLGGPYLCVKSSQEKIINFYTWTGALFIKHINEDVSNIFWNPGHSKLCIATTNSFFIIDTSLSIKDMLQASKEFKECVTSGIWVRSCFIYVNNQNKLKYYIADGIYNLLNLDCEMFILDYSPEISQIFLMEMNTTIASYQLDDKLFEYKAAITEKAFEEAELILPNVDKKFNKNLVEFLQNEGFLKFAAEITCDIDTRFEIFLKMGDIENAFQTLMLSETDTTNSNKWKRLANFSLEKGNYKVTKMAYKKAKDYDSLFLIAISTGDEEILKNIALEADPNIAFMCYFLLNDLNSCVDLLANFGSKAEAVMFAETYFSCDEYQNLCATMQCS